MFLRVSRISLRDEAGESVALFASRWGDVGRCLDRSTLAMGEVHLSPSCRARGRRFARVSK